MNSIIQVAIKIYSFIMKVTTSVLITRSKLEIGASRLFLKLKFGTSCMEPSTLSDNSNHFLLLRKWGVGWS